MKLTTAHSRFALAAASLSGALMLAACGEASTTSGSAAGAQEPSSSNQTAAKAGNAAGDPAGVLATDMVLGDPDAPVTLIEYASLTCPACANFHATALPDIKENYIDTGKVKLVFREFPTSPAALSVAGSVVARCAAEKNGSKAYFALLGTMFKEQRAWVYGNDPKGEILRIIAPAGIDEAGLNACLERQDLIDLVETNTKTGSEEFQITGTPTFVLGGNKLSFRTMEQFTEALDEALGETAGAN